MNAMREVVRALDRRRQADRSPSLQGIVSEDGWVDPTRAGELADDLPLAPVSGGSVGSAATSSRSDHQHPPGVYDLQRYVHAYHLEGTGGITVTHNLGRRPLVQVVDLGTGWGDVAWSAGVWGGSAGGQVQSATVLHVNLNELTVTLAADGSGEVICHG